MKALVAVKRVPDGNAPLRFISGESRIEWAGMPMRINPFDESALEAAVQWREAGLLDEVVVVSVGPDTAKETLRHALALGATRAIHITSDSMPDPLQLAHLLQQMVAKESPDLVLLGKQSSDEECAQAAPMLAGLLGWPQALFVSACQFKGEGLQLVCEIEDGQEVLALTLPAVLSADLRLANPRYLKLPQLLQAKRQPIETVSASSLGMVQASQIAELACVAMPTQRRAQKLASIPELLNVLTREGLRQPALANVPVSANAPVSGRVLLLAQSEGALLHPAICRGVSAAQALGQEVILLVAGSEGAARQAALLAGVSRVMFFPADKDVRAEVLAARVCSLLETLKPSAILAPANSWGRALLPRCAALLDIPMLSDVIAIQDQDVFVRPVHAGQARLSVHYSGSLRLLSYRPAAFNPVGEQVAAPIELLPVSLALEQVQCLQTLRAETGGPKLANARIVLTGGRGLGSAENFRCLLHPLAERLGAAIGATRAAVDEGFISNDHQIGQTGLIVAPEFYFALGLSGAAQHLAGMQDARIVVAINKDPSAPICQQADYVLLGDLNVLLPQLLAALGE